ncbi:MAG: hypothetical protein ACI9Y1_003680 [Lentisphaeria bacterium]|jgi:hypothetical protein
MSMHKNSSQESPELQFIFTENAQRLIDFSESFCKLLGDQRREMAGKTLDEIHFWRNPRQGDIICATSKKSENQQPSPVDVIKKNGEVFRGLMSW